MGENTCKSIPDKGLISKIYKELLQFKSKKNSNNNNPYKKVEGLNSCFPKKTYRWQTGT